MAPSCSSILSRALPLVALLALSASSALAHRGGHGDTRDRCNPASAAQWAERCTSGQGRAAIDGSLRELRQHASLSSIDSVAEVCELLTVGAISGPCKKARRQVLATALNLASGRIGPGCCVMRGDRSVPILSFLRRHDANGAASLDCEAVKTALVAVNRGQGLDRCAERRADDSGTRPARPSAGPRSARPARSARAARSAHSGHGHGKHAKHGKIKKTKKSKKAKKH